MGLYKRRHSKVVFVGALAIGGAHPIRIQSMTNTDSLNTESTVSQIISLKNAGCEIVRLTIPNVKSAHNLKLIRESLNSKNIKIPLVADIHYNFEAALIAADYVDKVRINPGNFAEDTHNANCNYDNSLKKITDKIAPFIEKLKKNNVALRIGVNHGSLSSRIMDKYGNTINGMVASAYEYIEICGRLNFDNIIISMKSSIPKVMIDAYRELVKVIDKKEYNYPLHLGVTEAGEGDVARIKSSVGILTLLMEGLGDTLRVSLTEPPENEILPAKKIVKKILRISSNELKPINFYFNKTDYNEKKECFSSSSYKLPLLGLYCDNDFKKDKIKELGFLNNNEQIKSNACIDFIYTKSIKNIQNFALKDMIILYSFKSKTENLHNTESKIFKVIKIGDFNPNNYPSTPFFLEILVTDNKYLNLVNFIPKNAILLLSAPALSFYLSVSFFLNYLKNKSFHNEVFITYNCSFNLDRMLIDTSSDIGALLLNYDIKGVLFINNKISLNEQREFLFNVLQSVRMRMTKADFIACPTCGRTNYDLFNVLKNVKQAVSHLVGIKIGVMGCIVNGPGEMADADYGCVGSKKGFVTIFRGKEIVLKDVPENEAVDKLVSLIKNDGKWIDKI